MRQISCTAHAALLVALVGGFGCSAASTGTGATEDASVAAQPEVDGSTGASSGTGASGSSASSSGQPVANSGSASANGSSGSSGASSGMPGLADAGLPSDSGTEDAATGSTGTFPAIVGDAGAPGPYATSVKTGGGPKGDGTVYYPTAFGPNGLKNPILVWDPGSGIMGTMYAPLLTQLASEGFAVYACASSSSTGTEVKDGIDWMIAQNTAAGSIFMGKLDTTKVAAGGHSLGSLAVFANDGDARLTTTVHVSGGAGGTTAASLKKPAVYLCGKTCVGSEGITQCDLAAPNCATDFMNTTVPVFYGQNTVVSHAFSWESDYGALTAWLRWQLMGDTTQKSMFIGPNCGLCSTPWIGMSKNLQ